MGSEAADNCIDLSNKSISGVNKASESFVEADRAFDV